MGPKIRIVSLLLLSVFYLHGCERDRMPLQPDAGTVSVEGTVLEKGAGRHGGVGIMTWNVYVGADVDVVLGATTLEELTQRVAEAYEMLQQTNFRERARTMARHIRKNRPHVIGLQEVSLIQRFEPANPAPVDEFNYLEILMEELNRGRPRYKFADSVNNADVTMPRLAGIDPATGAPSIDFVRLLDADVILVREDVEATHHQKGRYQAALNVPSPGGNIKIPRGYVSIVASIHGRDMRIVNTHLESFTELIRLPQAQELAATFAGESLPVVLVGDFNSAGPASPSGTGGATYEFLASAGYADAWLLPGRPRRGNGYTAPHDPDLRNRTIILDRRIDLVFLKGLAGPEHAAPGIRARFNLIGDQHRERTRTGMWPSDHVGVSVKLHSGMGVN